MPALSVYAGSDFNPTELPFRENVGVFLNMAYGALEAKKMSCCTKSPTELLNVATRQKKVPKRQTISDAVRHRLACEGPCSAKRAELNTSKPATE